MRSVVMATYNGEQYIGAQLDSILSQLSATDEIVVCDDASTDRTVQAIEGRRDSRIKVSVNRNRLGYIKNFQRAIDLSQGEYVFFADQDDVWLPDKVSRMTALLQTHGCVVSDATVVDRDLRELHGSFFAMRNARRFTFMAVFMRPCFIGATMACTSAYLQALMPFPANVPHDFWISLNAIWDAEIAIIEDPLILYRRHAATASITATQNRRRAFTIVAERSALASHFLRMRITGPRRPPPPLTWALSAPDFSIIPAPQPGTQFMEHGLTSIPQPQEIGIGDLLSRTWALKWILLAILVVFTAIGALVQASLVQKYKADILISAVTQSPTASVGGGMGGLAAQYGELASLAGLTLNSQGASNKDESIAVLQSELITEAYIKDHDLLPVLFADRWDSANKKWDLAKAKKPPTLWGANKLFDKKIRKVKVDKVTGLVTLTISWTDPVVAATWANGLVKYTNEYLRDKAIKESEQNISYLNEEAAKTNIVEAKAAVYSILRDEVNKQMVAKGREEYALKVLDPARAPEAPSTPPMILVAIAGLALGFVIAGIVIVVSTSLSHKPMVRSNHL